jgi:hypothetical protein
MNNTQTCSSVVCADAHCVRRPYVYRTARDLALSSSPRARTAATAGRSLKPGPPCTTHIWARASDRLAHFSVRPLRSAPLTLSRACHLPTRACPPRLPVCLFSSHLPRLPPPPPNSVLLPLNCRFFQTLLILHQIASPVTARTLKTSFRDRSSSPRSPSNITHPLLSG